MLYELQHLVVLEFVPYAMAPTVNDVTDQAGQQIEPAVTVTDGEERLLDKQHIKIDNRT